ncbi:MAG TPA: hypothetical protein VGK20_19485 [Candidatus Binatia bacterium]|jgi:hypothetical protein
MSDQAAMNQGVAAFVSLHETLPPVAMLLGGVPALTILVMTAVRYVASGTI